MSRSYRKPYGCVTRAGGGRDKRLANRKLRRLVRLAIKQDKPIPVLREVSDVWSFTSDGKRYFGNSLRNWWQYTRK